MLLDVNSYFYAKELNGQPYNLQGAIVINSNTEYLISVVDRGSAYEFYQSNPTMFVDYKGEEKDPIFERADIEKEFTTISENLYNQGFQDEESNYTYVMSYLLDKYNTGLTISTKKRAESSFKELKTNKTNNKYQPTKCP